MDYLVSEKSVWRQLFCFSRFVFQNSATSFVSFMLGDFNRLWWSSFWIKTTELLSVLSTTNWHLPRALPRTEQQRCLPSASWAWTPCCYGCWPSTTPEGVQGGVRHSVLQRISWDRSLDSLMLLGTDFLISILASPHI